MMASGECRVTGRT